MRVVCPFKERCLSYPYKCHKCRHNLAPKDFFEPETPWEPIRRERWIIGEVIA